MKVAWPPEAEGEAMTMEEASAETELELQARIAALSLWPLQTAAQSPILPYWQSSDEQSGHKETILSFRTEACISFQRGYCGLHRPKGKTTQCSCYHFDSQQRRPPVDLSTGILLYWDMPCPSLAANTVCPHGVNCTLAHSREEISYHPAKYKTRRCNGRGCRGESICCFAHTDQELRLWAPGRYSYWVLASTGPGTSRKVADRMVYNLEDWVRPSGVGEDWQQLGRGQLPPTRQKQRFCASYPDVSQCRHGDACAFAHSRDEAQTPLLTVDQENQVSTAMTERFFMDDFKTLWCPIGVQHDWQTCVYAHNYQDARRKVSIGYGPQPCPYWAKKDPSATYSQRCPLGLRCPYSHGAKEQLYHPRYFRRLSVATSAPRSVHGSIFVPFGIAARSVARRPRTSPTTRCH